MPGKWRFTIAITCLVFRKWKAASKPLQRGKGPCPSPRAPIPETQILHPGAWSSLSTNRYQQIETPIFSAAW